ncbi:MAG: TetR/AcrR family transcriptional regulator [Myxococcota bacterium]
MVETEALFPDEHVPAPAPAPGYAKSKETRARILNAALEEAGESGFYKASVARIAARAGVALGSLNYHFGSRAALMQELMQQLMDGYMESRETAFESQSEGDYFERERALLLAYVALVRRTPSYVRLAEEIRLHEPALYQRGAEEWIGRMVTRMRAGIAEGTLASLSEAELQLKARILVGARHALEELALRDSKWSDGAEYDDEAVVDAYLDLVRNGLGVSTAGAKN